MNLALSLKGTVPPRLLRVGFSCIFLHIRAVDVKEGAKCLWRQLVGSWCDAIITDRICVCAWIIVGREYIRESMYSTSESVTVPTARD